MKVGKSSFDFTKREREGYFRLVLGDQWEEKIAGGKVEGKRKRKGKGKGGGGN